MDCRGSHYVHPFGMWSCSRIQRAKATLQEDLCASFPAAEGTERGEEKEKEEGEKDVKRERRRKAD